MIICLDLDWDLDLGGLLTLGLGEGIVTLLPQVLSHPDDLLHMHCGLVLSFVQSVTCNPSMYRIV